MTKLHYTFWVIAGCLLGLDLGIFLASFTHTFTHTARLIIWMVNLGLTVLMIIVSAAIQVGKKLGHITRDV